jgi:hypothetical protein
MVAVRFKRGFTFGGFMKSKAFGWRACAVTVLAVLAVSIGGLAQQAKHKIFEGEIDAYSPQTSTTGPYEIHGPWSLALDERTGKADFYAAVNMELSDGWAITMNGGNFDPNARGAHTHHIVLHGGTVTAIANGFQVTGTANFTLSGGPAPTTVAPSPVVIAITGGTEVQYSNIALTFEAPGSGHFGAEPLPGVVHSVEDVK